MKGIEWSGWARMMERRHCTFIYFFLPAPPLTSILIKATQRVKEVRGRWVERGGGGSKRYWEWLDIYEVWEEEGKKEEQDEEQEKRKRSENFDGRSGGEMDNFTQYAQTDKEGANKDKLDIKEKTNKQ